MDTMRDVRNRMRSVRQTKQVTGALKLISTSKLRKARRRYEDALPYFEGIADAMRDIVAHSEEPGQKWFDRREHKKDRRIATLIITADMGKAGAYNSQLIRFAEQRCPPGSIILPIGQVGRRHFAAKGFSLVEDFAAPTKEPSAYEAKEIAAYAATEFLAGSIDEFRIVYTRMRSIVLLVPSEIKLLPLEAGTLGALTAPPGSPTATRPAPAAVPAAPEAGTSQSAAGAEAAAGATAADATTYNYLPSEDELFDALVPQYLKGIAYGALVSAYASEQAARMTAMDAATKNAEDMLERLTLNYNRARQASITKEVSEIVGGAAALED